MTILGIDELDINKKIFDFENSLVKSDTWHTNIVTKLEIKVENDILMELDTDHGKFTNINESYDKEIQQIFKVAGLCDLNFDFTPNNTLNLKSDERYYVLSDETDMFLKKWKPQLRMMDGSRKSSSVHMSTPFAIGLLEDRVKFKFYAARNHLNSLKDMEAKGETPHSADVRIKWEITVENLLFHLVGAMDSLLVRIVLP